MKKKLIFLSIAIQLVLVAHAQKPKATFDHDVFAKRVVQYMNLDITAMCAKDNDLQYMATATGKPLEELRAQYEANKLTLKEDIDYLNKNGILRIYDKAEVSVTQETPLKVADIIMYCHYKDKHYTLTLTNCVQTNTTWVLGDGMDPKGDDIADLISAKRAKEEKFAGSTIGIMAAKEAALKKEQAKKDSADWRAAAASHLAERIAAGKSGRLIKGYQATLFPEKDRINYTPYFHPELYDQYLPGYYIDRKGNTAYVDKIKYSEPYTLLTKGPVFDPAQPVNSEDIAAFYVGDQLFVQFLPGTKIGVTGYSLGDAPPLPPWAVLISEGAIRRLVSVHTMGGTVSGMKMEGISADRMFQKLDENVATQSSMTLQFKKKMIVLVSENSGMATKITDGAAGYHPSDIENIVLEYNLWYDKQYPEKVKYLPVSINDPVELVPIGDDFVSINTKEELKKFLAHKVWETVSATPYDGSGNKPQANIVGVTRLKSSYKYSSYELFSSGKVHIEGAGGKSGTWDTKDGKTITVNGSDQIYNITGITTSTFSGDVNNSLTGVRETIMFRMEKELSEKD